ncbi:MAG: hypothetical protein JWO82_194 [Akkermansiaceae bacterium]|nr:hypothetical protein [Akkermansiaceae bacterium]
MTPWPLRTVPRGGVLAGLLCLLGAGALGGAGFLTGRLWARHEAGPPPVIEREPYTEYAKLTEPRPLLADSLGKLLEVQGIVESASFKGYGGPKQFYVETVGGREIEPGFRIVLRAPAQDRFWTWPQDGERVVLRGYESGGFVGIARGANEREYQASELFYLPDFRITQQVVSTPPPGR